MEICPAESCDNLVEVVSDSYTGEEEQSESDNNDGVSELWELVPSSSSSECDPDMYNVEGCGSLVGTITVTAEGSSWYYENEATKACCALCGASGGITGADNSTLPCNAGVLDPGMAPPGKHVMSCFVQYAPYDIATGPKTWPEHREAFGDAVIDTLAEYMPSLKEDILHRQVLSPLDIEDKIGITEGNIFHGELGLEQLLFQRPVSGWARYRTPIQGLWLGGSGAHPGGGIMGSPGALAAKEMLKVGAV